MFASAAGEGTPQCFLLTPKLLPDLPFTHSVNVLLIMNGPNIQVSTCSASPATEPRAHIPTIAVCTQVLKY
jgi:structural maintenance of chromosomes protein 5